jgi:hypothetical protein
MRGFGTANFHIIARTSIGKPLKRWSVVAMPTVAAVVAKALLDGWRREVVIEISKMSGGRTRGLKTSRSEPEEKSSGYWMRSFRRVTGRVGPTRTSA